MRATPIANDHFNTRMCLQPIVQWFGFACGEHIDWFVSLHLDQHSGVSCPAAQQEIIDTQHTWDRNGCDPQHLDQPEQRIGAGGHAHLAGQARATLTAGAQPELGQQARCVVGAWRATCKKTVEPLGEDPAGTCRLITKLPPTAYA
jgi:hypothetical protein